MNVSKRLLSVVFVLWVLIAFFLLAPSSAQAKSVVIVTIDGKQVEFKDAYPESKNGRLLVPARAILEPMGASIQIDSKTGVIVAEINDKLTINLKLNSPYIQRTVIDASGNEKSYVKYNASP